MTENEKIAVMNQFIFNSFPCNDLFTPLEMRDKLKEIKNKL